MHENFKVVGYYPCWKPEAVDMVDLRVVTHLNYAFVIPTEAGDLLPLRNPDTARALIEKAHSQGVKVLIVVGGWDYEGKLLEQTFARATDSPEKREKLANAILDLCDSYGFDGVDIDWEYPRAGQPSQNQYEDLMLQLGRRLHAEGKLLTCAVFSGIDAEGNVLADVPAYTGPVLETCDLVNIMAYDGGDGEKHSSYDFALGCARCWLDQGVPGEKLTLGLPFYGRPCWDTYGDLCRAFPDAQDRDWVMKDGRQIWYNGKDTIRAKTRYALEHLGGVMIWELTQDSEAPKKSLLQTIGNTVL